MRFENRHAVVTGGASGIGAAITARLATEGAQVTVWDISEANLAAFQDKPNIRTRQIDVTDATAVSRAMAEDQTAMGGLDTLVCSAGITGPNTTVIEYPTDAWKQVFDLNVHGLFYCNRAAAALMRPAGFGRIVNMASIAGKEGNPNASAYSASKAAVIGLTKSLGKELADTRITVNAIAPAAVHTAIFDQMTDDFIAYMKSKIPMGRFGSVEEIAAMACWLASDEASFTTGAVFDQSGGRAVY
ncbi:SDR family NAD(P)-dependent oxidoreductase [Mameliella sediminis]|uniref:SDR family NAD(P)-dependent oxidoreductase n=1 Tax=Mameliella sediminis TaxID=2836866 RepID=UPI001C480F1A|nr:SDR family NAD(P)-dependent oxidoreductase [Mameliella sediminis]MBY6113467.1 SDR family oxidoreductase [Antarctobacter heliothermus]MBY6143185.1 SDR family oxidoreductase [Mameliella alba]MBV7394765.1 SDR family oxidoreductase [Mameliella sediminis]MBY6163214.1 SDR family oxidoreductase [Mameliella alba]MBY6171478.1 SDR family oxidoreductase [Mameliella alba]